MIKQKLKICSVCKKPSKLWKSNPALCYGCSKNLAAKEAIEKSKGEHVFKPLTQTEDGKEAKVFKYQTKKIKQVSTRQQLLNREYSKKAKQFKKDNPVCKARIKCIGAQTVDVHHTRGRGEYFLQEKTWLPVCRECHQWINENNKQAMALGFTKSRLSKAI